MQPARVIFGFYTSKSVANSKVSEDIKQEEHKLAQKTRTSIYIYIHIACTVFTVSTVSTVSIPYRDLPEQIQSR